MLCLSGNIGISLQIKKNIGIQLYLLSVLQGQNQREGALINA